MVTESKLTVLVPLKRPENLAAYWGNTKYIYWPKAFSNPSVRVPTPNGEHESLSIAAYNTEAETYERCLRYREQRGIEIWGKRRWEEIVSIAKRSVAKHRKKRAGPITGVHLEERDGRRYWMATWYEREEDGQRRKRSKQFSYGGPFSKFETSDQAMLAAIEKRENEEARWYSVTGEGEHRKPNRRE